MDDFRSFIEEVKDKADLLQMIEETGAEYAFDTTRRGKYFYGKKHDSLAVDSEWQQYTWFSKNGEGGHQWETGDVFDWVMRYRSMDFWAAAVFLADRYGIRVPDLKGETSERAKSFQTRGDLYSVVHEWLVKQLWASPAALDYCRRANGGRAWADETICYKVTFNEAFEIDSPNPYKFSEATMSVVVKPAEKSKTMIIARGAGLGFAPGTSEGAEELKALLQVYGFDIEAPEAVAIIGMRSGVQKWLRDRNIEGQGNWLEQNRIYGLVDFPRLIYPHFGRGGKPVYFSARSLKWERGKGEIASPGARNDRLIGDPEKKSYNPPKALMGERMWYFNWLFHKKAEEVVIVEGQADAITLGEWGLPAIALNGLGADQGLADVIKDIRKRFLALDADKAGQAAMMEVAQIFGPKIRLVRWEMFDPKRAVEMEGEGYGEE